MRLRTDVHLIQLGHEHIVIDPGHNRELENYIYPMTDAAALLWETFQGREADPEAMADVLCANYDVSRDVALQDIREMLSTWTDYGLII